MDHEICTRSQLIQFPAVMRHCRWNRFLLFSFSIFLCINGAKREMASSPQHPLSRNQIVHPALSVISIENMAKFHSRSNSLPLQSNPVVDDVQDHLCRLKASTEAATSASFMCESLVSLRDLHEGINNLIQMPSVQVISHEKGENWVKELLEGSLRLVDLCGFSRDVVRLTKESVQELGSSIRRSKGETATADHINAYIASRKKINKMVNKCIKNLKSLNENSTALQDKEYDLKAIVTMLKEIESLDFSVLKSVLQLLSGERERSSQRSWLFLSKLTQTSRVYSEAEQGSSAEDLCSLNIQKPRKSMDSIAMKNMVKQLNLSEMMIQELDEGLESLFRSLVKTRVSLLNVLSHQPLRLVLVFEILTRSCILL